MRNRKPAVAGFFYPGERMALHHQVKLLLDDKEQTHPTKPKFLVCPHAGYRYSGGVQAAAMKELEGLSYDRVILLGPSHRYAFNGMIGTDLDSWETPLGQSELTAIPLGVQENNLFHEEEHSLEVQLPFLQELLPKLRITPILLSGSLEQAPGIAEKLLELPGDNLFLISSDFHHVGPRFDYHPQELGFVSGEAMDQELLNLITSGDAEEAKFFLKRHQSTVCGALPILVGMRMAKAQGRGDFTLKAYDCSGNMVGGPDSVGYAALVN